MADGPSFGRALRRLDGPSLRDLVAELCAARGRTVRRKGRVVVAGGPTTTRYLVVPATRRRRLRGWLGIPPDGPRWLLSDALVDTDTDAGVDVVVSPDAGLSAPVADRLNARAWGAADLLAFAAHAVDRPAADRVLESAVGDPVAAFRVAGRDETRGTDAGGTAAGGTPDRSLWSERRVPVVAAALALVTLGVVAVVLAPALGPAPDGGTADAGGGGDADLAVVTPSDRNPSGGPVPIRTDGATPPADRNGTGTADGVADDPRGGTIERMLAPGLSPSGVTSERALGEAHATAVAEESYVWRLDYREATNGSVRARATEVLRVASPGRYVTRVDREGNLLTAAPPIALEERYATGTTVYRRPLAEGYGIEAVRPTDHPGGWPADRAGSYVEWYATAADSSVVDRLAANGSVRYVVVLSGSDVPRVSNYTARLLVDGRGVVHELNVTYRITGTGVTVRFTAELTTYDDLTVDPPQWWHRQP